MAEQPMQQTCAPHRFEDLDEPRSDHISAAKVHVLQLDPIKQRVGDRWPRLSLLVHKLVNTALEEAQGPGDHFEVVGELAYVATFRSLSQQDADATLGNIMQKVCEKLWSAGVQEISVRSVVGGVPSSLVAAKGCSADAIGETLEKVGSKTVVSIPRAPTSPRILPKQLVWSSPPRMGWIQHGHQLGEVLGIQFRFAPVWELQEGRSRLLALTMNGRVSGRQGLSSLIADSSLHQVVDVEIPLLFMTASLAQRMGQAGEVASLMVGVSHNTVSHRETRTRYLRALKDVEVPVSCPILLRIEMIPDGAVLTRVAQIASMLVAPNVRVVLDFQNARQLPPFEFRLPAAGISAVLPHACDGEQAAKVADKIVRRSLDQKCLSFLHGVDSAELAAIADKAGVKFATGKALEWETEFTGLDAVPQFPLYRRTA
jgi:hypothetical protein